MNEQQMSHRSRRFAYLVIAAVVVWHPALAAPAAGSKTGGPSPAGAAPSGNADPSTSHNGAGSAGSHVERQEPVAADPDVAARSRMHECGHQWSTIKKAGNAGSRTWKEFSATCLVVR